MYAALRIGKHGGQLLSNDLMRDHIRDVLNLKIFKLWTTRHCAKYHIYIQEGRLVCDTFFPPSYSHRFHFTESTKRWHVPRLDEEGVITGTTPRNQPIPNPFGKYSWFCAGPKNPTSAAS